MSNSNDPNFEVPGWKSKKLWAMLIGNVELGALGLTAFLTQDKIGWELSLFMAVVVFIMGFTTVWYIGRQAAVDALCRGVALLKHAPKSFVEDVQKQVKGYIPEPKKEETPE